MSSQLLQLLANLDREGATELVISIGRPVALRVHGAYQTVSPATITQQQLEWILRGTPIVPMLAESTGVGEPRELELGARAVRAQVIRNGKDLMVRFEPSKAPHSASATPKPRASTAPGGAEPQVRFARPGSAPHAAPTPAPVPAPVPMEPPRFVPAAPVAEAPARAPRVTRPPESMISDERSTMSAGLATLVRAARERSATDLHVAANRPVMIRAVGELVPLAPEAKTASEVEAILLPLIGAVGRRQLDERGYVDLAVEVPGAGRLRGNISRQQGGLKGAFRIAKPAPPTLAELGLPADLAKVTAHHQGLVVIAGPSGHGKTTTLAALVDVVNSAEAVHILTIEDPVEIEHPRKAAVVSQREVGRHTVSFAAALKASLREDPDVIVIGELRDRETVEIALTAAETGHLVISTMSTPSAAKTIDRLIDMFPPEDQSQVRASLAGALKAIVAQRLLPNAQGTALVPAVELVAGSLPLATLIRENKLYQLPNLMQRGRSLGMMRLDESLLEHARAGRITEETALAAADNRKELLALLRPQEAAAGASPAAKSRFGGLFGKKKEGE